MDKYVDEHFEKAVNSSKENFVNFVKINTEDISESDMEEIEWLAKRVAQNMFYYKMNIERAKSDYIILIGKLIERGLIFEKYKDLKVDSDYPY